MLFLTSLRFDDFSIYHSLNQVLVNVIGNEDFFGYKVLLVTVKLPHISQEIFLRLVIIRKHIDMPLNEFALTNKENLDAHPPFIDIIPKNITVHHVLVHPPLYSAQGRDGLQQVTVFCRTLKSHFI